MLLHLILMIKLFNISAAQGFSSCLYNTELDETIVSAVAMIVDTIDLYVSDSDIIHLIPRKYKLDCFPCVQYNCICFHQCWLYSEAHSMLLLQFFSQLFSCFSSIFCLCANHLQECSFSRWISRIAFPDSSNSRRGASHLWLALL
jgi:hypothetical protein